MWFFKNGDTIHLYSNCKGIQGAPILLRCTPIKVCGTCKRRSLRFQLAVEMQKLHENGSPWSAIGFKYKMSRQAAWEKVKIAFKECAGCRCVDKDDPVPTSHSFSTCGGRPCGNEQLKKL